MGFCLQELIKFEKLSEDLALTLMGKKFLEFQNKIIPLVDITGILKLNKINQKPLCYLIYIKVDQETYALLVHNIIQISHEKFELRKEKDQADFVLGSCIVEDRLTNFINIHKVIQEFVRKSRAA